MVIGRRSEEEGVVGFRVFNRGCVGRYGELRKVFYGGVLLMEFGGRKIFDSFWWEG